METSARSGQATILLISECKYKFCFGMGRFKNIFSFFSKLSEFTIRDTISRPIRRDESTILLPALVEISSNTSSLDRRARSRSPIDRNVIPTVRPESSVILNSNILEEEKDVSSERIEEIEEIEKTDENDSSPSVSSSPDSEQREGSISPARLEDLPRLSGHGPFKDKSNSTKVNDGGAGAGREGIGGDGRRP